MSSLIEIRSEAGLSEATASDNNNTKSVLLFGADWHEACPMLRMVLGALAGAEDHKGIVFGDIDAESAPDLSDRFGVTMVPTILLLVGTTVRERLEGEVLGDPSHVTLAVQRLASFTAADAGVDDTDDTGAAAATAATEMDTEEAREATKKAALHDRLERLIHADAVMLFMKGTPEKPRCGFSRQAVEILRAEEIPFGSFDILGDDDVRQGLKTYSDWPTYPQIVSLRVRVRVCVGSSRFDPIFRVCGRLALFCA